MQISTYDSGLVERMEQALAADGFKTNRSKKEATQVGWHTDPFLGLFAFPAFDMAFLRYQSEHLDFELDGRKLCAFGVSDYGLFVLRDEGIDVLTPEHELLSANSSMSSFVASFRAFVSVVLKEPSFETAEDALLEHRELGGSEFWNDALNAVTNLGHQGRYGLLTGLRDGKLPGL